MLSLPAFLVYLRDPDPNVAVAEQIVALTNGLVAEATGPIDGLDPFRVQAIRLEVARRAYDNQRGFLQESVDDWSGRRPEDVARAGVYLTDAERAELVAVTAVAPVVPGPWLGSMPYVRSW